ncbi:MAG: DNA methyltransferase [Gemmatimonadetes bacterium SCN 70-22]|nr:MAG: DNA methyltransferase [Gemmatimonadetes bacterium SCN 70-22]
MTGELIVDSFAGGGGASLGIEMALGRSPDIAINHDAEAIALHALNHPTTRHYQEDVWRVDPAEARRGQPVGLMWLSPDCKHFSKAKGGKPVSKRVRGLAWVAVRWAAAVRPRVIMMENVEEFRDWGPVLVETGRPCPVRKGQTFRAFVGRLRRIGYAVEWRELRACDYGAPTRRKRLFLVARRDGQPIVWPAPTHGKGCAHPWRTAAECIDWSIPVPSIFERARPLAESTLRRIAAGMRRYVLETRTPFIVPLTHHGDRRVHGLEEPLPTVTGAHRGELALVAPTLIQTGYGERAGQAPRALDLGAPLGTAVAGGVKHALVMAFLAKHQSERHAGEVQAASLFDPVPTVKTRDSNALVTATLTPHDGGDRREQVRAFLVAYYGSERDGQDLFSPLRTVTSRDRLGLVTVHGADYAIADIGMRMLTPRELYRAQGFPDSYRIDAMHDGRPLTKTAQVRMVGNSVCPPVAAAIVAAQFDVDVASLPCQPFSRSVA